MTSDDLTKRQVEALKAQCRWMLRYLAPLQSRMIKRKFLESKPLLQRVRESHSAVHTLSVELHYLSCDSGVGRVRKSAKSPSQVTAHESGPGSGTTPASSPGAINDSPK